MNTNKTQIIINKTDKRNPKKKKLFLLAKGRKRA